MPILYTFRRCPYAIRARMALFLAKIQVEIREVVLKDKPTHLLQVSPKGTVPVLVLQNQVIEESLDIIEWAIATNDKLAWLYSHKNEICELTTENDRKFKFHLDRYKYPQRFSENANEHFKEGCKFLEKLDNRLRKHSFLCSENICVADIAIFPFVRQFAGVDIPAFEKLSYTYLQKWFVYHKESECFQRIMKKYPQWREGNDSIFSEC